MQRVEEFLGSKWGANGQLPLRKGNRNDGWVNRWGSIYGRDSSNGQHTVGMADVESGCSVSSNRHVCLMVIMVIVFSRDQFAANTLPVVVTSLKSYTRVYRELQAVQDQHEWSVPLKTRWW